MVPAEAAQKLLAQNSVSVAPIFSRVDKLILVQSHKMSILNPNGSCALGPESLCENYSRGVADPHVLQIITTALSRRCQPVISIKTRVPIVWDLGSNIGQFSLIMRSMGCHVLAVEPQPIMNWFHKASVFANGWYDDRITLIEKGVSDAPGSITLTDLWQPGKQNGNPMNVSIITTEELAEHSEFNPVDLIKIDVDGPEILILRGLVDLISTRGMSVLNIIVELTVSFWRSWGVDDPAVVEIFNTLYINGFQGYLVYETEFAKYPSDVLEKLSECRNMGELSRAYRVPKELLPEVLWMTNRVTKNILFTRDVIFTSQQCV